MTQAAGHEPLSVSVVGSGVVGERVHRLLGGQERIRLVGRDLDADAVVLASPAPHATVAAELVSAGVHVVSLSGSVDDVRALLDLDDAARRAGTRVVVSAAVSPGLSGLLARQLHDRMARCDELHIAVHGTAGPACAREHHRALDGWSVGRHDGGWIERPSGSGRELCWFPEPVGARDCYRAELADPLLLQRSFPDVVRISARQSATRRDRFTARLPMLSPPHREGGVGALRVEARGHDLHGARVTTIGGIAELIGTAAAAVAAAFVVELTRDSLPVGVVVPGDETLPTAAILATIQRGGVRFQSFTGVPHTDPGSSIAGTLAT